MNINSKNFQCKIAVTGHTSGIGKEIFKKFENTLGYSRKNNFDITDPDKIVKNVDKEKINVFINNARDDGFSQLVLLEKLYSFWNNKDFEQRLIINISSFAPFYSFKRNYYEPYDVQKEALDSACKRMFLLKTNSNVTVTNLRLCFVDTPSLNETNPKLKQNQKMKCSDVVDTIDFILKMWQNDIHINEIGISKKI